MADTIDARGLSCPQPVILAKNAIKKGIFPFDVLVDSAASRENVTRMTEKNGCTVSVSGQGEYVLTIDKA